MTTLDKLIASDLTSLGADNRRGAASLDELLRPRRVDEPAGVLLHPGAALYAAAGVFTDRVARLAGGAVAALAAIAAVIALHRPAPFLPVTIVRPAGVARSLGEAIDQGLFLWARDRWTLAVTTLLAILAAQQLARYLVTRWLARRLASDDALARVRRLARAVDAWSAGVGAGGIAALGALVSVASVAAGSEYRAFFEPHGERLTGVLRLALHVMTPAVPLALVIGFGVAAVGTRARPRLVRILESCSMFQLACSLMGLSLLVGGVLDFGVGDVSLPSRGAPATLQLWVSLACVLSILAFSLSYTLRRRRREQQRLL